MHNTGVIKHTELYFCNAKSLKNTHLKNEGKQDYISNLHCHHMLTGKIKTKWFIKTINFIFSVQNNSFLQWMYLPHANCQDFSMDV